MTLSTTSLPSPLSTARDIDDERLQLLRCMLADRDWTHDPGLRARLQQAMATLSSPTAITMDEATWTLIADETAGYLDFRRLRNLEAQLRGCPRDALRFTRADWEVLRVAEAALEHQLRHVRDSSYAPEPVPLFRIH
jgi:hypothetical protein